ncbi:hypothetical protein GCM10010214_03140 [Streptomyces abikoensis]|nr:hypothetical protein GCM10010214_03140 [Streptomyces abikoensis]
MGSARGDGSRGGEFASAAALAKALGRPAALDEDQVADVGEACAKGAMVKALVRGLGVVLEIIRRGISQAGGLHLPVQGGCPWR